MSKTATLRWRDVRDAYRLIGECRDLGRDPALWHRHMLDGLRGLIGVAQATGGEGLWQRSHNTVRPLSAYDVSSDGATYHAFLAYHRSNGFAEDPFFRALQKVRGRLVTLTRRQLVPDAVWYRSPSFIEYRRPAAIDHEVTSLYQVSEDGAVSAIALHRLKGERDFTSRERRLLHFVHGELGRLVGGPLRSVTEPDVERLAPRVRETLACLLEGDSEKQVAARLGLSVATVHQYVATLYRHFRVSSRAQLLTHILKRVPLGVLRD
jgi:DNA-binding CsgD family transcriptional regulator